MNKREAQSERARLQDLLDGYEADRLKNRADDKRRGLTREQTPDRADKIRARIARLSQIIGSCDQP